MADSSEPIRVLVVDDDPQIVKVMRLMLKIRGYEVLEALRGAEGVQVAQEKKPDVILLDIMMPDIDGYDVFRQLRLDPATMDIPVIFVSAKASQEHVDTGLSLGAEGYITKPFQPEDLLEEISRVLGKG